MILLHDSARGIYRSTKLAFDLLTTLFCPYLIFMPKPWRSIWVAPFPSSLSPPIFSPSHHFAEGKKTSRNESKARKAFGKLGLKNVPGVTRIVVKRGRQVYFTVNSPDVFKSATNDNSYVFFGEVKTDDVNTAALQQQAMQFAASQGAADDDAPPPLVDVTEGASGAEEAVDETGINPKHVELVLEQAPNVTRAQAVAALRKTGDNVVNAIMELTMS